MLSINDLLTFYVAVLAIQLTPGPDMMLVIGRGIGQGRRTAVLSAIGMTLLASAVQILLLIAGIASLLRAWPLAFEILRWAGAAYLIWLGAKLLFRAGRQGSDRAEAVARTISDVVSLLSLVFTLIFGSVIQTSR